MTTGAGTHADALRLRRQLVTPRRIEVWTTPGQRGVAAARVLYRARRRRARIAGAVVHTRSSGPRLAPVAGARHPVGRRRYRGGHRRSCRRGRGVARARVCSAGCSLLTAADGSGVVVKLGLPDDEGLAREATTMSELSAGDPAFRIPTVRWHGTRKGWFAIVTDIAKRKSDDRGARSGGCPLGRVRARRNEARLRRSRRSRTVEHRADRDRPRPRRLGGGPLRGRSALRPCALRHARERCSAPGGPRLPFSF